MALVYDPAGRELIMSRTSPDRSLRSCVWRTSSVTCGESFSFLLANNHFPFQFRYSRRRVCGFLVPVKGTGTYLETSTIIPSGTPIAEMTGGIEAFWAAFATSMAASSVASFSRRLQSVLRRSNSWISWTTSLSALQVADLHHSFLIRATLFWRTALYCWQVFTFPFTETRLCEIVLPTPSVYAWAWNVLTPRTSKYRLEPIRLTVRLGNGLFPTCSTNLTNHWPQARLLMK